MGLIVSYNTAWRANNSVYTTWTNAALKNFELIILYLQWWNEKNVRSTVHFIGRGIWTTAYIIFLFVLGASTMSLNISIL